MTIAIRTLATAAVLAASFACANGKSANPLSPDVAGPIPGVSITAPKPLEPFAGQQLEADGRPQSLLIENAGTSGARELFLEVDLAADANFQQMVHQAHRLTPGGNGRTSYRLPDPLSPNHTYYWRARALDGANTGPYSAVSHFAVVEPVRLEAPEPIEPRGTISSTRPNFVVRNGRVSGPVGDVVYRFEIGTAADQPPAAVVSATPGSNGSTTVSLGDLPYERTLFWRVYATTGGVSSAPSAILAFRTPNAPPPPPPPVVVPTPGAGSGGSAPTVSCAGGGPSSGLECARAVAAVSPEWSACARGDGVACHRFTRQVGAALSRTDPNWKLIMAGRGGHACHCSGCGASDGTMFREDTLVYGGNRVFDMIGGAGAPGASLGWGEVPGPRSGDTPADAPVCR